MAVALDTVHVNWEGDGVQNGQFLRNRQREVEKERETAGHIVQHCASYRPHPVIAQVMAETTYQLED